MAKCLDLKADHVQGTIMKAETFKQISKHSTYFLIYMTDLDDVTFQMQPTDAL
jgi:hypothetical protein